LFKATRESLSGLFGDIEHLPVFDMPGYTAQHPSLSSDGSALYFTRLLGNDLSTGDIYVSYTPYLAALTRIENAIAEKLDALDKVNAALEEEWTACEALQELLESGDYGDLSKGDIVTAMQKVYSAIRHEELAIKTLDRSIEKLEDALAALGWQPPPPPPPMPPPVSHWTFDEGSGTTAYDSAGTNDGTVHGATWTTGQINGALSFDGMNDYVDMADTVKNYLDTSYTVSAWIKTNTVSAIDAFSIIAYRHSTDISPVLFAIGQYNADVHFAVRDNSHNLAQPAYANALTTNTWYHVAGVREENTVNVYVNGVSGTPVSKTLGEISPDNLKIGAILWGGNPVSDHFNGAIDDVMIFDTALSAQEIQQLYNNGLAGL
jgi:tetratricopeptide (TPR) repeat protein